MQLPVYGGPEAPVNGDELCADGAKPASDVESLERQTQCLISALPACELPTEGPQQLMRQVVRAAAAHGDPHRKTGVAGLRFDRSKPRPHLVQASLHQRIHAMSEPVDVGAEIIFPGHHHFCRR